MQVSLLLYYLLPCVNNAWIECAPTWSYASSVWDPYLKEKIEHVQKFVLKVCQKDWHSNYDTLLNAKCPFFPPPSCQVENIEALSVIYSINFRVSAIF